MKLTLRLECLVPAMLLAMTALLCGSASASATGALQAENKGDTNTSVSENALGLLELDYIPCRFSFGGGSSGDQVVEIDYPFNSGGTTGLQNLFFLSNDSVL